LLQMVVPVRLAAFYPLVSVPIALVVACSIVIAAVTIGAWMYRAARPYLLVGWLWYLVMLVPVLGLVQAGGQAHADRFTYLPQIGLCIIIAYGVDGITAKWRPLLTSFAVTVVVALSAATFIQTEYWRDSKTLWTHSLACTTDNAFAENNLGAALASEGKFDDAVPCYEKAILYDPKFLEAHNNLGVAFAALHRFAEAADQYQTVLNIKTNSARTLYNYGNLFDTLGKSTEATLYYQRAVAANPDYEEAQFNLGNELLNQQRPVEASAHLQRAVELAPEHADAHGNLANALATQGRLSEAIPHYERALQLNHGDARTWYNYGLALSIASQFDTAINCFRRAIDAGISQTNSAVVNAAKQQIDVCESKKTGAH
jgi:tetratricopeptide (TPR) repeat protein